MVERRNFLLQIVNALLFYHLDFADDLDGLGELVLREHAA